jgi:hypothetical protein
MLKWAPLDLLHLQHFLASLGKVRSTSESAVDRLPKRHLGPERHVGRLDSDRN